MRARGRGRGAFLALGLVLMAMAAMLARADEASEHRPSARQEELIGTWVGERNSDPIHMTLRIDPDTIDSVVGSYRVGDGPEFQLAGELSDLGAGLSIEESPDGRSISGHWVGTVSKERGLLHFKGTWIPPGDGDAGPSFELTHVDNKPSK